MFAFSSLAYLAVRCCVFSDTLVVFFACKTTSWLVFLLYIRRDNLRASYYIISGVFSRLFHCCFGVFSLLCGLFQVGTALYTLCFCPIYPLLRLSLAYSLSRVPCLPEDIFLVVFLALFYTIDEDSPIAFSLNPPHSLFMAATQSLSIFSDSSKLDGANFPIWKMKVISILRSFGHHDFVVNFTERPTVGTSGATQADRDA